MGEKNDKSKYMEGNYSKNPFKAELEYRDDLIQAEQLQMQENRSEERRVGKECM